MLCQKMDTVNLKAAIIYIFYNNMTMCDVRGVAGSDEPAENYQPSLQLALALWSFIVRLSSLFSCQACNFTVFVIVLFMATNSFLEKKL